MRIYSVASAVLISSCLLFLAGGQSAAAQDAIEIVDTDLARQVAEAEAFGWKLRRYDQAAWHATDALFKDIGVQEIENPRGYVVVPRATDTMLDTVFVVEREGELRQYARYVVDGGSVVSGGVIEGSLPLLTGVALEMFAARGPALDAMRTQDYRLCSERSPNTLVLPPDENGAMAFFMLTSTTQTDIYPIGGHYRADVRGDGTVASTRRYTNTCYDLPLTVAELPDAKQARPGISYVLGDAPSEIHAFASYHFPQGMYVITTSNSKLWLIEQGKISLVKEDFAPN